MRYSAGLSSVEGGGSEDDPRRQDACDSAACIVAVPMADAERTAVAAVAVVRATAPAFAAAGSGVDGGGVGGTTTDGLAVALGRRSESLREALCRCRWRVAEAAIDNDAGDEVRLAVSDALLALLLALRVLLRVAEREPDGDVPDAVRERERCDDDAEAVIKDPLAFTEVLLERVAAAETVYGRDSEGVSVLLDAVADSEQSEADDAVGEPDTEEWLRDGDWRLVHETVTDAVRERVGDGDTETVKMRALPVRLVEARVRVPVGVGEGDWALTLRVPVGRVDAALGDVVRDAAPE